MTVSKRHRPSPVVLMNCLPWHFLRFVGQLYRHLLGKFIDSSILSPGGLTELEVESDNLTHRHTLYRIGRLWGSGPSLGHSVSHTAQGLVFPELWLAGIKPIVPIMK